MTLKPKDLWKKYYETGVFPLPGEVLVDDRFYGKVYSKGRPRFSGNHAYTPPNTRKFEAEVADWMGGFGIANIRHPVSVEITLCDPIAKSAGSWRRVLMLAGIITSTVGDLDNRAKSILDAMNKEFLMDDSLINRLSVTRKYDEAEGFHLTVSRSGYSPYEIDMIGAAHVSAKNTTRRRP